MSIGAVQVKVSGRTGVLLMTFGSPADVDDVPRYLRSVRGGREPDEHLISEFQRRYRLIGGSPLLQNTEQQALALSQQLTEMDADGSYRVAIGMRHSSPTVGEGVVSLIEAGSEQIVALVLSPQYSPVILAGYLRGFQTALAMHPAVRTFFVESWHLEKRFVSALAARLHDGLSRFPADERNGVPIIFTAHSMPRSVAEQDPGYVEQLRATAEAIAARAGLDRKRWQFAYQSAGHTPVEWMTPDIKELFPEMRARGHQSVLIVPVQFLSDHLEVLYDIDIAAREEATRAGIRLERTESLNDPPLLARALADVVVTRKETVSGR